MTKGTIGVDLRMPGSKDGGLTAEDAKQILGWEPEPEKEKWSGEEYTFKDRTGTKVRLGNNPTNRPFRMTLANRWASEMLRGKWSLNGETIVVDCEGDVADGQHRLVGLVLAEQSRAANPDKWGKKPIEVPALIVTGVSDKPEVTDTLNLGQKRSLGDVIFRRREFENLTESEQKKIARILAGALRLVWLRVGGKTVSDAPHFPHSEALEFLGKHPYLVDASAYVFNEEGGGGAEGRLISSRISLGYAAGLLYLGATAKSDPDKDKPDRSLWEKAEEFWTLFASGAGLEKGSPILSLRGLLEKAEASGAKGRDAIIGMVAKAWNAFVDGKKLAPAECRIKERVDKDTGRRVLAEEPRMGGLDVEREPEPEAEPEPSKGPKPKKPKPKLKEKGKDPNAGWKVADTAWFLDDKGVVTFGIIEGLDKGQADIKAKESGQVYTIPVGGLGLDREAFIKTED